MLASSGISTQITANNLLRGDILNKTSAPAHVMLFSQWLDESHERVLTVEARSFGYGPGHERNVVDIHNYSIDSLVNVGYVPRRFNYVEEPDQHDPVIVGHFHCKYAWQECQNCFKYGHQYTLEITATDQDGDSMYYEWLTYYGWFIVDGQFVYICTTAQNYVTYLAPSFGNQDRLDVTVHDVRGGSAFIEGSVGIYAEGTKCRCGDVKDDGVINGADIVFLINYLYQRGPHPDPMETADPNNDCVVNAADIVYLTNYLYLGGPPPECCWIH
jgi:hypothetical protein